MDKVPTRVDGRFRLGDMLGSGSYAVVYRARNIIKDNAVAIKLEPINHSSSVQREYRILKNLEGGIGIPRALWFGDQLLSHLEYIHSHNYIHGDIKPQNVVVGLGDLKHTAFLIDFSTAKEFWNTSTRVHIPFRQGQRLTSTPAFTSINNHLGLELGRRDDLESLTYMLIYCLQGSLPWLTSDQEKLSSSSILERKVNTTIEVLCQGIPVQFATILIYTRALTFSEDPDYNHIRSLLRVLHSTSPAPASTQLDFGKPDVPTAHPLPCYDEPWAIKAVPSSPCLPLHRSSCVLCPHNHPSPLHATASTPRRKKA
ncbi:CK1/CK1/CK1-D protein kinase [Suillus discolor]|uniref:non-specific serine/threonine protein kinase n=1 Tax=Suillus discolor TaxID=1912936 RepID=A0A9P7FA99_9AGAM|nr:CK1/CK1/CK1-D protein kinase [Suillus discolor]KAG2109901.1 CK1/CK1/CK1-D protein kinase [Suillus discolor]